MKALNDNQITAVNKLNTFKVGALFMQPGTGKTRAAVELVNSSPVDLVEWIGPINTIRPKTGIASVADEVNLWGGFLVPVNYTGIESIQASDRIWLEVYNRVKNARNPFIIIDESLKVKNATAKRTKRLLQLSEMAEYKLILNGTPLSRNLLDIYSQMQFLSPKILNMSLAQYYNTFCAYTKVTKFMGGRSYTKEFITGYENIDYLYSLIKHYVFECDLNLQVNQYYTTLPYSLDDESKSVYEGLKEKYLDDEVLQWKNNNIFIEMTQKMQHSYCITLNKFEVLDELFKTIDQSRTIIFCKYIASREICEKYYPKATVLSYQKEAFGLNMQHLNNTVYFDKVWDYALRVQAGHRTFRTGQEYDCRYYDLTGNVKLENLIDTNVDKKVGMIEYFKNKTKTELNEML
ncbi:MAG TPA: hypothetical protein DCQ31_13245 [Bacteroidales bacterium]|nr:hypothetical protein [Bacteroidales bacterium]